MHPEQSFCSLFIVAMLHIALIVLLSSFKKIGERFFMVTLDTFHMIKTEEISPPNSQ